MLYPYDVIRLKQNLGLTSDRFLDQYVDVVLRPGSHFPDVLLKMADNEEKTCPFLTSEGCSVYPDRPDTCRTFPVEQGVMFDRKNRPKEIFHLFRPPNFCLGQNEIQQWTIKTWDQDQEAEKHHEMTLEWSRIKHLFQVDPWRGQGPDGPNGKMAFMAAYNVDAFRQFVLESSFLKRYKVKPDIIRRIRVHDMPLMKLGFDWIRLFVWGMPSKMIRPKF